VLYGAGRAASRACFSASFGVAGGVEFADPPPEAPAPDFEQPVKRTQATAATAR